MFKKILLFGLMTIIISVIVVSAYEDKFPRIGYTPPYMGGDSTYNQYFAQAVNTLHLTALIQNIPNFQSADFYAATLHHLNLVNTNATLTFDASSGQYSMYQADRQNEPDYFQPPGGQIRFLSTKYNNAGHGRQIQDDTIYAWFVSKDSANDNPGYVLDSLWNDPNGIDYSREQDYADRSFYVIFKLKVPNDSTIQDTTIPVARLEAISYTGVGNNYDTLADSTLRYCDFKPRDQYQACTLKFYLQPETPGWPPKNNKQKDYRVYWYKNTDLYIDYVEVYDSLYNLLFNVKACDTCSLTVFEWLIINDPDIKDLEESYNGSSLYRWILADEPTYDQYKSSRRVSEILADNVSKPAYAPGIQATGDFRYRNIYRYVNEVEPREVFYDDYPIYSLIQENNDVLQDTLDSFASRLWKVNDAARSKSKEWWYIAHTFKVNCAPPDICRYPHNSELKATVYMALAYGAKGIGYYEYTSRSYPGEVHGGLVDSITAEPIQTYPPNEYYSTMSVPEILFTAVKEINEKLDVLGPILKKLEWKWAGSSDSLDNFSESFVSSVSGVECDSCDYICKYPIYSNHIQVGMFKDNSLSEDYLMLVNRWVGHDEKPCERVVLSRDHPSYLYDCSTGELLDTLTSHGAFHVILYPGEGKLFRLANFLPSTMSVTRQRNPQRFNLYWTDPNIGESGYKIERRSGSVDSFSVITTTSPNMTTYQDSSNLIGSEIYYYRVRAFDQQYNSEYSNIVTVKSFPNSPRNLTSYLNRIPCPGRGGASGSGMGINGLYPYCYTNEIILSWQQPDPSKQKSGSLRFYKIRSWQGSTLKDSMTVSSDYTSTIFCVPQLGTSYTFRVYAIDYAGDISDSSNSTTITSGTTSNCIGEGDPVEKMVASVIPTKFELFQNYPNPSNAGTLIKYALPQESDVKLVIYNILGQKVRVLVEDLQEPGYYTIFWDGKNQQGSSVGSGIYFYRIQAGDFTKTAKMSLLK